jgi:hypothetical protein
VPPIEAINKEVNRKMPKPTEEERQEEHERWLREQERIEQEEKEANEKEWSK